MKEQHKSRKALGIVPGENQLDIHIFNHLRFIALLVGLVFSASNLQAANENSIVELKGVELPEALGKPFGKLTLFSVRNGMLLPIPFQWEDFDDEGYSWFPDAETPLRGHADIVDEHDSLFFRFADAGSQFDAESAMLSRIGAEIKVYSADGENVRFVYISDELGGFTHKPLTQYNKKTGEIRSDYFSLNTQPENFLIWNDFTYKNYTGENSNTLLDTLKIRLEAGIILDNARITLDNRNIKTSVVSVKQGPIRTVVLAKSHLTVASVPVIFLDVRFQVLPQQFQIDAKVHVPAILAKLLRNPTATISLDGANLKGSILRTAEGPETPVQVDGIMSEEERELIASGISRDNNWVWLSTQSGFDIIAQMHVPANFDVPISLHYIDNDAAVDKPERFAGQGPNVGYRIHDIPVNDTFHFNFQVFFTDSIEGQNPAQFVKRSASIPYVSSRNLLQNIDVVMKQKDTGCAPYC